MTPFVNILPYHTSNSKNSNCKKKRHVSKKANVSNSMEYLKNQGYTP